jgi:hypothetical protein
MLKRFITFDDSGLKPDGWLTGENKMSIELKQDIQTIYSTADKLKEYL